MFFNILHMFVFCLVFCTVFVLFLLLCYLFPIFVQYKSTDHCHQVETQLQ